MLRKGKVERTRGKEGKEGKRGVVGKAE